MTSPQDRVQLLKSQSARLNDYLSALTADDWSHPTACAAWQVRDVVTHMTIGGEAFAGNIARGLAGDSSPPEGMPPPASFDLAARMVANARGAISNRERLGEQLQTTFGASCDALDNLLAGIGSQDWDQPCFHPAAIIPVRTYVDLRLAEIMVHEWDIRSKFEGSVLLPEECLPAMVDVIEAFVVGVLFNPGSKLKTPVRYRFELTGAVTRKHDIVVGDGKARMQPAGTAAPDVTFRCGAETFVLLAYERLTFAAARADGQIVVEGDRGLADQFAD